MALSETLIKDLLFGTRARDQQAFARLYDATSAAAFGVARAIVEDDALAEDVLAEAYLQVWQRAGQYDPQRGGGMGWLLVIVRNRAIDVLRRRSRDQSSASESPAPSARDGNDPADLLSVMQRNCTLYAAIATLTPAQRQLLALAFFRGLTHSEIAHFTALPLGSVKTMLRSGLRMLRKALETHNVDRTTFKERAPSAESTGVNA